MKWNNRRKIAVYRSISSLVEGDIIVVFDKISNTASLAEVLCYRVEYIAIRNGEKIWIENPIIDLSGYRVNNTTRCVYSTVEAFNKSRHKLICKNEVG